MDVSNWIALGALAVATASFALAWVAFQRTEEAKTPAVSLDVEPYGKTARGYRITITVNNRTPHVLKAESIELLAPEGGRIRPMDDSSRTAGFPNWETKVPLDLKLQPAGRDNQGSTSVEAVLPWPPLVGPSASVSIVTCRVWLASMRSDNLRTALVLNSVVSASNSSASV